MKLPPQKYIDTISGRSVKKNVVDFSQKKLLEIAERLKPRLRKEILQLLARYMNHQVAIVWIDGSPSFVYLGTDGSTSDDDLGSSTGNRTCK